MMRKGIGRNWRSAVVIVALAALSGCGSTGSTGSAGSWSQRLFSRATPAPRAASSNVVIVRGTAGYWPGVDHVVSGLEAQGARPTMIRGWEINRTAGGIVEARRSGEETRPLVLIGYSRGANDAIRLTRRLQNEGVTVNLLVLMETAVQDTVPANVESCLNIYKSSAVAEEWVPAFRGLPVTVESAHTQLVNYNVRFHDEAIESSDLTQFTVSQNPTVVRMIAERVGTALRPFDLAAPPDLPETQLAGGVIGDHQAQP